MKICKIWDSEYPWDVRVEKVCTALVQAGHQVHLICRNNQGRIEYEFQDGLHIHRLARLSQNEKLNGTLSFPVFFNPFWISKIQQVVKEVGADIILVRDLPLALAAIAVARICSLPVIFDMAEDYPELCKEVWKLHGFKLRNILIRNPALARVVEKLSLRLADHIVLVSNEFKERLSRKGIPDEKISVVMNTPSLMRQTNMTEEINRRLERIKPFFKMVYLGVITKGRGITTAIKSMPFILSKIPNARLIIIGTGNFEAELTLLVKDLQLEEYVIFEGWIDHYSALHYVKACDIGIMPHHVGRFTDITVPNKLFDYMQMGLPIVTSNATAVMNILKEVDCGEVFEDPHPEDFARAVIRLKDPAVRRQKAVTGKAAVQQRYNWERSASILTELVERTVTNWSPRSATARHKRTRRGSRNAAS